jgi:hypothetical protein
VESMKLKVYLARKLDIMDLHRLVSKARQPHAKRFPLLLNSSKEGSLSSQKPVWLSPLRCDEDPDSC